MAQVQVTIECGYCLRKDQQLSTPKFLPCSHVHCMQCLSGFFEETHTLVCPVQSCGEIVEGSPDTLPSYDMAVEDNTPCDVCMDKYMDKQEAVIYCTVCCHKFCEKHLVSHDGTMDTHEKISIEDYKSQTKKTQPRNCPKHEDQPYVTGCKLCLNLFCNKCPSDLDKCANGVSHNLLSLDDLVAALIKEDISAEMIAKEDQYEKLFKDTSKARVGYDNRTTEMVQLIRETRDAQTDEPKPKYKKLEDDKYKKLEDEVTERRQKSSVAMAEFMEDIVLKKWTQLTNHRKMTESRVKCSHQVDVVKGIKELKEEMLKFVEEELLKLKLTDQVELKKLGWTHPCNTYGFNILTVVADQVVIADATNRKIIVYSLTGESLRRIPCPSRGTLTICAVDSTSIVISNFGTSKVFRVNITTGEVMWTSSDVNYPRDVVRYGSYILLSANNNKTIYILDTTTGNIVSKIVGDVMSGSVFSLGVYGTTLVVPLRGSRAVYFYQLNMK